MKRKKLLYFFYVILIILSLNLVDNIFDYYDINRSFDNEYIEYHSAEEYKNELLKAIYEDDAETVSNLIYSLADSKYYNTLYEEIEERQYNLYNANSSTFREEKLYSGYILLLNYIDINKDSEFRIKQIDETRLSIFDMVYFEYELDGIDGYFINDVIKTVQNLKSLSDSIYGYPNTIACFKNQGPFTGCFGSMDLDMVDYPYNNDNNENYKYYASIDMTIVMEDYKNENSEPIFDYKATYEVDDMINTANMLDIIMDEDTSDEQKIELQNSIIVKANDIVYDTYGDNDMNGNFEYVDDSIIIEDINNTYNKANKNDMLTNFIAEEYYDENGDIIIDKYMQDASKYGDMYRIINSDINGVYVYDEMDK